MLYVYRKPTTISKHIGHNQTDTSDDSENEELTSDSPSDGKLVVRPETSGNESRDDPRCSRGAMKLRVDLPRKRTGSMVHTGKSTHFVVMHRALY